MSERSTSSNVVSVLHLGFFVAAVYMSYWIGGEVNARIGGSFALTLGGMLFYFNAFYWIARSQFGLVAGWVAFGISTAMAFAVLIAAQYLFPRKAEPDAPGEPAPTGPDQATVNSCLDLLRCQRGPPYKGFQIDNERYKICEECLSQDSCPTTIDGNLACEEKELYRPTSKCQSPCVSENFLDKLVNTEAGESITVGQFCESAISYGRHMGLTIEESIEICKSSEGACWFGCDGELRPEVDPDTNVQVGATCTKGAIMTPFGNSGKSRIGVESMGRGFPTEAECQSRTGMKCGLFGVNCQNKGLNLARNADNCYCDIFRPEIDDPCAYYEQACDADGIAMTMARAKLDAERAADIDIDEREVSEASERLDDTLRDLPGTVGNLDVPDLTNS